MYVLVVLIYINGVSAVSMQDFTSHLTCDSAANLIKKGMDGAKSIACRSSQSLQLTTATGSISNGSPDFASVRPATASGRTAHDYTIDRRTSTRINAVNATSYPSLHSALFRSGCSR